MLVIAAAHYRYMRQREVSSASNRVQKAHCTAPCNMSVTTIDGVQDDPALATNLTMYHESVLSITGSRTFKLKLKVSAYYPYELPEFRIVTADGLHISQEQLAAIAAHANVTLALRAPHDPFPLQFNGICKMLQNFSSISQTLGPPSGQTLVRCARSRFCNGGDLM
jgi:hypothetical protein